MHPTALLVWLAALACPLAHPAEFSVSGRASFAASYRLEAANPDLLGLLNAPAAGLIGRDGSGANADDANLNFRRHDATSAPLKAFIDFAAREGNTSALLRVKAWHDFALARQPRAWGNVANGYAAGQPLSDRGAPALSRFSGIVVGDAYVQQKGRIGDVQLIARAGQQNLGWGARTTLTGGLEALNPKDFPAMRRPLSAPQEIKVPVPMLFARAEVAGIGLEGFYQTRFRPSAIDMCGTFWSLNDYIVDGCDKVMSGLPAINDRVRIASGAYLKRLATPKPDASEFGFAFTWRGLGLYHAQYTARTAMPGLRKSTRVGGPAIVTGDPDGRNIAFFTEYPEAIRMTALTFQHKRGMATMFGELSYRPNMPLMLPPGDVLPAFASPVAASQLRADANALAPGALFHGYDSYPFTQAQAGLQLDWNAAWSTTAEVVAKRVGGLPDQSVRRYGRADVFGVGLVGGNCVVTTPDAARQCSLRGYVSTSALAYRLRADWRLPQWGGNLSVVYTHDVRGWSADNLINEGRKALAIALRVELEKRYIAELAWTPIWGGDYNPLADRDQLSLAVGVNF